MIDMTLFVKAAQSLAKSLGSDYVRKKKKEEEDNTSKIGTEQEGSAFDEPDECEENESVDVLETNQVPEQDYDPNDGKMLENKKEYSFIELKTDKKRHNGITKQSSSEDTNGSKQIGGFERFAQTADDIFNRKEKKKK